MWRIQLSLPPIVAVILWTPAVLLFIAGLGCAPPSALVRAAIIPPPWSDPNKNPCASMPGGWQLLYWAPLRECFKIFQVGYPCPDTMELSPIKSGSTSATGSTAECRCPPGKAQFPKTAECYTLFQKGPCEIGQYFAPLVDTIRPDTALAKKRWGICKTPPHCLQGTIFWPQDSKCYTLLTRGPCPKGKLLTIGNSIAECKCDSKGELARYYNTDSDTCHEHYTRGPCQGHGELFLPGGKCGCHSKLPHYHSETDQCYEIGSVGPCPMGHTFIVPENSVGGGGALQATCQCKDGYSLWQDGYCYRLYTRGPCGDDEFLMNATACVRNPCTKGQLYFPSEQTCYRIGSQGPCSLREVVVFDFTTRPSVDGISFNGVCGCSGIIFNLDQSCSDRHPQESACNSSPGLVELNGHCFKLYTRGPCAPGQWLEPKKDGTRPRNAKCQCRPGYTHFETDDGVAGCQAPSVGIARYLNGKSYQSSNFG